MAGDMTRRRWVVAKALRYIPCLVVASAVLAYPFATKNSDLRPVDLLFVTLSAFVLLGGCMLLALRSMERDRGTPRFRTSAVSLSVLAVVPLAFFSQGTVRQGLVLLTMQVLYGATVQPDAQQTEADDRR